MSAYNPQPTWAFRPGHFFRLRADVSVVDEDYNTLCLERGSLLFTGGMGMFVIAETGRIFRVDELDALIIEYDAELLS